MSKETQIDDEEQDDDGGIHQSYIYWANLMVVGDAPTSICRYPSQSSVLARSDGAWQSLDDTTSLEPPLVELLD
jgi:hypothetical protein